MVEMQFKKNTILRFLRKVVIVLNVIKLVGISFQIVDAATEKVRLSRLNLVLEKQRCC